MGGCQGVRAGNWQVVESIRSSTQTSLPKQTRQASTFKPRDCRLDLTLEPLDRRSRRRVPTIPLLQQLTGQGAPQPRILKAPEQVVVAARQGGLKCGWPALFSANPLPRSWSCCAIAGTSNITNTTSCSGSGSTRSSSLEPRCCRQPV